MNVYQVIETSNFNLPVDNKLYKYYWQLENKIRELEAEDVGFPRKFNYRVLELVGE